MLCILCCSIYMHMQGESGIYESKIDGMAVIILVPKKGVGGCGRVWDGVSVG